MARVDTAEVTTVRAMGQAQVAVDWLVAKAVRLEQHEIVVANFPYRREVQFFIDAGFRCQRNRIGRAMNLVETLAVHQSDIANAEAAAAAQRMRNIYVNLGIAF